MNSNHWAIVVRFSLRLSSDWCRIAYGHEENRANWVRFRLKMLRELLLSSLRSMSISPAMVFLLADRSDRELVKGSDKPLDGIEWVFSDEKDPYGPVCSILRDKFYGAPCVISRVDSDDILGRNFGRELFDEVSAVEGESQEDSPVYLIARYGARSDGLRIQYMYYSCSPFLSLYTNSYKGENIYSINHEEAINYPHRKYGTYSWCQAVHKSNVSNKLFTGREDYFHDDHIKRKICSSIPKEILIVDSEKFPQIIRITQIL